MITCALNIKAQNKVKWMNDFLEPHIAFETNYFIGSPTISDDFINSYFDGDFLNDTIKNEVISKLNTYNIFGAYNNFKLSFTRPIELSFADHFHFAIENRNTMDLRVNDNLFKLVFNGNEQFAGEEIEISNNHLYYSGFSQVKAGFIKSFYTTRFDHTFALIGSINIGTTHNYININNASLLTADNGTFIDSKLNAEVLWAKNNSDEKIKFINGLGGGIDLFYHFECDRGNNFSLAVNDIGFIHWFEKHSTTLSTDTSIYFDGLQIDDILNISATTDELNADSLKETFKAYTSKSAFTTKLPFSIQAHFSHDFNDKLSVGAGFMHVSSLAAKPFYFADLKYQVFPFLQLVPNVSYGAYSKFAAGMDLVVNFNEYYCYAGSDFLTSFLNSDKFTGTGFYFKIVKKFNGYEKSSFRPSTIDMP